MKILHIWLKNPLKQLKKSQKAAFFRNKSTKQIKKATCFQLIQQDQCLTLISEGFSQKYALLLKIKAQPQVHVNYFFYNSQMMKAINITYKVLLNDLILVDFNDKFVKSIDKWQSHSNEYLLSQNALPHRAFSIFLFNTDNQLLLQKRSAAKKTFPLCWTNTCCSHPNMIENEINGNIEQQPIRQALHRALIRELGMHIPDQKFYFMEKILYKKEGLGDVHNFGEFEVDYVFLAKLKGQINFKPVSEEIAEINWIKQQSFPDFAEKVVKEGGYFSPWFFKMFKSGKIDKWWDLVAKNELKDFAGEDQQRVTNML